MVTTAPVSTTAGKPVSTTAGVADGKGKVQAGAASAQQKAVSRRTVDYIATYANLFQARLCGFTSSRWDLVPGTMPLPMFVEQYQLMPPISYLNQPAANLPTKLVTANMNKAKSAVNTCMWLPDGRRCMTGANSGEMTFWDGRLFTLESVMQGHETAIRSLQCTHSEGLLISSDDNGRIKLWNGKRDNFLDPLQVINAHREPCRSLSVAPTDRKFASASDDSTIKVIDILTANIEATMLGHGGDVRWVEWHSHQGLLASASKDALAKLWDPRAGGSSVATLHGHKNGLMQVRWNPHNGHWLLTASRDQTLKVYDVRTLREISTYQGHARDVTSACWHPVQEECFVSGGFDGSVMQWLVSREEPQASLPGAHDREVWGLAWHPVGHLLVTVGGDQMTKFWCRARPGDFFRERWDDATLDQPSGVQGTLQGFGEGGGSSGAGGSGGSNSGPPGLGGSVAGGGLAARIPGLGDILNKIQHQRDDMSSRIPGIGGGGGSGRDRDGSDRPISPRPGIGGRATPPLGMRSDGKRGRDVYEDRPGGGGGSPGGDHPLKKTAGVLGQLRDNMARANADRELDRMLGDGPGPAGRSGGPDRRDMGPPPRDIGPPGRDMGPPGGAWVGRGRGGPPGPGFGPGMVRGMGPGPRDGPDGPWGDRGPPPRGPPPGMDRRGPPPDWDRDGPPQGGPGPGGQDGYRDRWGDRGPPPRDMGPPVGRRPGPWEGPPPRGDPRGDPGPGRWGPGGSPERLGPDRGPRPFGPPPGGPGPGGAPWGGGPPPGGPHLPPLRAGPPPPGAKWPGAVGAARGRGRGRGPPY